MTYKHEELVRAWLSGQVVQYRVGEVWADMPSASTADKMPHFYAAQEYRVKPMHIRVRLGLLHGGKVLVAQSLREETEISKLKAFREWLGDWQEYGR